MTMKNYSVIGGPQNALSQLTYDASNNQIKFTTSSEPDDGDSVTIVFEDKEYLISKVDGEIQVSGGEENRLSAFINSGISFESNNLSRMDLSSQRTVRYQNIDYLISRDAAGDFQFLAVMIMPLAWIYLMMKTLTLAQ